MNWGVGTHVNVNVSVRREKVLLFFCGHYLGFFAEADTPVTPERKKDRPEQRHMYEKKTRSRNRDARYPERKRCCPSDTFFRFLVFK